VIRLFLPIAALIAAIWASRVVNPSELGKRFDRVEDWIGRLGPGVAAAITVLVVWWTWGHVRTLPASPEESSYVLQAGIFAHGRWTAPSPPMPEFFEQPQVLVTPAVASKFPPGNALVLAVGALLHFLPFVPLLVAGLTAALIIAVGVRVLNPWMAVLAWLVWLTTPMVMRFQSSYFAEPTATLQIATSWWCLLRWREKRALGWIAAMAAAIGWAVITQPLPGIAFGLPTLGVAVVDMARGRNWRAALTTTGALVVVLAVIPLWNARTTGDRSLTPLTLYTMDYMPFDRPGFSVARDAPRRALSPVMLTLRDERLAQHEALQPHQLAMTTTWRFAAMLGDLWQGAQLALVPFFIVGLFAMSAALRVGLGGVGLLLVGRIPFAQDPAWTLPYLPIVVVVAAITACGIWRTLVWAANGVIVRLHIERRPKLGSVLVTIVLALFAAPTFSIWRARHHQNAAVREAFEDALGELPSSKSIIFLRYAPRRQHLALVNNSADLQAEPIWVVHDLGEHNRDLLALVQDRTAYVFDERTMEFKRF
jgi:hypothetical protein